MSNHESGNFEALFERARREQRERDAQNNQEESLVIFLPKNEKLINISPIHSEKELNNNKFHIETIMLKKQNEFLEKEINLISLKPNIDKLVSKNKIQIQYNPNFARFNFNALPQAGITVDTKTKITADNIAEFAYPLAQFVQQVRPDYIIACDRGARIIGLAVHMLYQQLYGALPTLDHSINFRKISRRVPADTIRETLQPDIERMLAASETPTVLVLDDWVASGGTKNLVYELFSDISGSKINVLFGVMRGGRADVTGSKDSAAFGDWHDRADLIGVDYDRGSSEPFKVDSPTALNYRKRMSACISRFVNDLTAQ